MEARFASLLLPILASTTGTHFPIFCPSRIGSAVATVIVPLAESACKIPTVAEELWITAVSKNPTRIPISGLLNEINISLNCAESLSGANVPSIVVIPQKRIPKPIRRFAIFLGLRFFDKSMINAPTTIITGAKEEGFNMERKTPPPLRSPRRSN